MSVTKQQQLKYLAEGGSVWPYPVPVIMMSCNRLGESVDHRSAGQVAVDYHYISFAEWREERDKIETKAKEGISWYEQDIYPPTGTECEFRYKYSDKGHFEDWNQGIIKYIGNDLFVAEVKGKELAYNNLDVFEFRPVINKRDRSIEDMLLVLTDLDGCSLKDIVSALYDAGYDKPFTQGVIE